jgi:hypothetical protein
VTDLKTWRTARKADLMTRQEYQSCSRFARRLARHLVVSRDALDGAGMFRSPRKLAGELNVSESTVRRGLRELVEKGVFEKELRTDPRGTGRRHTTSAYRVHPALNVQPGYVAASVPLRCVTNDIPNDTPTDTPRSSKLLLEAPPSAARVEVTDVVDEPVAAAEPCSASDRVYLANEAGPNTAMSLAGETPARHTYEISSPRNQDSLPRPQESWGAPPGAHDEERCRREYERELSSEREKTEFVEAFRELHGREPHPYEHIEPRKHGYAKETARLRSAATIQW